jgi:hypothetical protein
MALAGDADKKSQPVPRDRIDVVGHIALPAGSITGLAPTRHFSSDYVYAEYDAGKRVAIIDVTKPSQPSVISDVASSPDGSPSSVIAIAGTSALALDSQPSPMAATPSQSVKIMDYADAKHPRVVREFSDVTAIGRDDSRGLIFLADSAGVWILQDHFAEDPAVEAAYAKYVLNNR